MIRAITKQNIEWSVDDRTNEHIFDQRPAFSKIVSHRIAWRRVSKNLKKNSKCGDPEAGRSLGEFKE